MEYNTEQEKLLDEEGDEDGTVFIILINCNYFN
jgi:hypothetical protein